jgi:competence protein ComEA
MNGKERFAGAVLVVTLAIGIIADVLHRQDAGSSVSPRVSDCPGAAIRASYEDFRKLDINTAGVDELEILPGIGPKKAKAIVEYRERHGRFQNLHRLTAVKGIGEKTLERIAPYVFVSAEVSPAGE